MLTEAALKSLKPKEKIYKVSDRDGMYVRVAPSGAISCRLDYRLNGRRETMYLGRYARDGISLARARELCIDARRAITEGRSPAIEKQREKRRIKEAKSFGQFGEKRLTNATMADSTRAMRRFIFERELMPVLRNRLLTEITPDEAPHYPPYHYEHALLHLKAGDPISASTRLRHGFVANGYIAEMLSGNPELAALAIWHGSNLAEPETARDYLNQCGDLWQRTPDAVAFVRWLHTHHKVLAERAAILECQEVLLWEHDFEKRRALGLKEEAARARIDDILSVDIVRKKADRHGRPIEPWRYQRTRF